MMNGTDKFKENTKALIALGVQQEIGPSKPQDVGPAESELNTPSFIPAEIALRGLKRAHAILLFKGFNRHLNPLTDPPVEAIAPLEFMTDEELESLEREAMLLETGPTSDFNILLQETDPALFDIEIRPGGDFNEDPESLRSVLQGAYFTVMSEVDLVQASLDPELAINKPTTLEKPIITSSVKSLSVKNRTNRSTKLRLLKNYEKQQFDEDLDEIKFIVEILGLENEENVTDEELVELWRSKNRDHIAILDLFMHAVSRKQEVDESAKFHSNTVTDLIEYGKKHKDPLWLRRELEDKSIETLITKLKISPADARSYFLLADSELEKMRIRVVAWLAEQPIMGGFRSSIQKHFKLGQTRISHAELFKKALDQIKTLGETHDFMSNPDSWGSFESIEYDRDISFERDAYNRKLNFFINTWMLAAYVFTNEDIDQLLKK